MKRTLSLLIPILAAAAVRIIGLGWGLPDLLEEATPYRKAYDMWGFLGDRGLDLNPDFFNYPSLVIYLQFLTQAVTYGVLRLTGGIEGSLDFRLLYHVQPDALVIAGRITQVLVSLAGVVGTFLLAGRLGGRTAGLLAALAVALNPILTLRAQMIEVDGPLLTATAFALWAAIRLLDGVTPGRALLAGALVGLAASTKYPGILLLVPALFALFLAPRRGGPVPWRAALLVGAAALAAFALTSPYVFLDWPTFRAHLALEQDHIARGHFGEATGPAYLFYLETLGSRLLGWPGQALALAGLLWLAGFRRDRRAWVLAAFLVLYFLLIGSVAMRAPRYALPLLPALLAFAGAAAAALVARFPAPAARTGVVTAAALVLVLGPVAGWGEWRERRRGDNRTLARQWIEENHPAGSMVATEFYGPDLFGPLVYLPMDPELRDRIMARREEFPLYGLLMVPMFQVVPERSANFYDIDLYPNVDLFVTSSLVRDRYEGQPGLFRVQVAFYDSLEARFEEVARFGPDDGAGPEIVVYRNPENDVPFGDRNSIYFPRKLDVSRSGIVSGEELFFYYNLGLIYETFDFIDAALTAYGLGLAYPGQRPHVLVNTVYAACRQFARTGRLPEAQKAVDWALEQPGLDESQLVELRRLRAMVYPSSP